MVRRIAFLSLTLLVSGCLLNGNEKPPAKLTTPFNGSVTLMDVTGVSDKGSIAYQAEISAHFTSKEPEKPALVRRYPLTLDSSNRQVQCQLFSESETRKSSEEIDKGISVGALFLGTPTSSQEIEIPQVSSGNYQKELLPHFSPGIYLLRAAGLGEKKAFHIDFSMPEELREPRVNEHGLEEGPAVIQKSSDFFLELEPATAPNDFNIIEISLLTAQEKEQRVLVCGVLESQLEMVNGKTQLKIPAAQLSGLFATPQGVIQILRVNAVSGVINNGPALRVDGLRAWVWPSLVAE